MTWTDSAGLHANVSMVHMLSFTHPAGNIFVFVRIWHHEKLESDINGTGKTVATEEKRRLRKTVLQFC